MFSCRLLYVHDFYGLGDWGCEGKEVRSLNIWELGKRLKRTCCTVV